MTTLSQNGYPANDVTLTRVWTVGNGRDVRLKRGDAGWLLVHFADWFDAHIEDIDAGQLDDWGYAERDVRGGGDVSNHASGTAIDLNATRHPMGVSGTFTPAQAAAIRAQLARYDGCIRWGGDYTIRPDEMHFEINRPLSDVSAVARRLRQEDDMALSDRDIDRIWNHRIPSIEYDEFPARVLLDQAHNRAGDTRKRLGTTNTLLRRLTGRSSVPMLAAPLVQNPLTGLLPAQLRAWLYAVLWMAGVALAGAQAGYLAAGAQPMWLNVAWAVYGVLSAPSAALARANVTPSLR